jgi:hypothetical protein
MEGGNLAMSAGANPPQFLGQFDHPAYVDFYGLSSKTVERQGCQMFANQNLNVGIFWALERRMLVYLVYDRLQYFTAIWYFIRIWYKLWSFGIHIFPTLVNCTKKNLAIPTDDVDDDDFSS